MIPPELIAELPGVFRIPHNDQARIITGNGPNYMGDLHAIHRQAGSRGRAGRRLDHYDILRVIQLTRIEKNIVHPGIVVGRVVLLDRVAIRPGRGEFLYDPKLLYISRNRCLCAVKSVFLQSLQKLLLGFISCCAIRSKILDWRWLFIKCYP